MPRTREADVEWAAINANQKRLDREAEVAAKRSELAPASGLNEDGAPPTAELAR